MPTAPTFRRRSTSPTSTRRTSTCPRCSRRQSGDERSPPRPRRPRRRRRPPNHGTLRSGHEGRTSGMKSVLARRRRSTELLLGLLAVIIVVSGYVLVQLSKELDLPPDLWVLLAGM